MADTTENTSTYNALGDKPTNWQAFEDDDTSTSTDVESSLAAIVGNESAIASLASIVGAVIMESWKTKDASSADSNMFTAIEAIIKEQSGFKSSQSTALSNISSGTELIIDALSQIDTHLEQLIAVMMSFASTQVTSMNELVAKGNTIASIDKLLTSLATVDSKSRKNILRGMDVLEEVVDKLDNAAPKFDSALSKMVDSLVKSAEKLAKNKDGIKLIQDTALQLKSMVDVMTDAAAGLAFLGISFIAFGASVMAVGAMVSMTDLFIFSAVAAVAYGAFKLFQKFDAKSVMQTSASIGILSASLALLALTVSVMPDYLNAAALVTVTALGIVMSGFIFMVRKMKPAEFGKEVLLLSASIATLTLAASIAGAIFEAEWDSVLKIALFVLAIGASVGIANKLAGGGKDGKNAATGTLAIASSIAIMGLAIWGWHQLVPSWEYALMPIATMLALAGAMAIIGKFAGDSAQKAGIGMLAMSAAVGVLAIAMLPWQWVEWEYMAKAGAAIGVLGLVLSLVSRFGKANDMLEVAAAFAVASISVAILGASMLIWQMVDEQTIVNAGIAFATLATSIMILGKDAKSSLIGSSALAIGAASTLIFAFGLQMVANIETETFVKFGAFIVGIAGLSLGLGVVLGGVPALLGAAALAATGASVLIYANAVSKIAANSVKWDSVFPLIGFMTASAALATGIGNPFTVAFTLAGGAALVVIGSAVLQFSKSIKQVASLNLTEQQLKGIGDSLSQFIIVIVDAIAQNEDKMDDAENGIEALSDLGNLIYSLSEGLQGMATLVFPKYGVKDGKLVIVGTIDLKDALPKIGESLSMLISALEDPLAKIGSQGAWYSGGNKVKRGIDALQGIGNVLLPFADSLQKMADLKFPEYEVQPDGSLKIVRLIDAKVKIPEIADNLSYILGELEKPFAKIGESGTWFNKNHTKKGVQALAEIDNVLNPISTFLKTMSELKSDVSGQMTTYLNSSVDAVIGVANKMLAYDADFDALGERTDAFGKIFNTFAKTDYGNKAKGLVEFASSFSKLQTSFDALNLEKLGRFNSQIQALQNRSIIDSIKDLAASINGPLTAALEKLFAKLEQAINKLNLQTGSTSDTMVTLQTPNGEVQVENVQLGDVYSILYEIYDTLTGAGVRTR